jgi:hypothetical protein
LLPS